MAKTKKLNKGSAGQNRKASEIFIEKYQRQPDVVQTHSGLLYRVIDNGTIDNGIFENSTINNNIGTQPTMQDSVVVNQRILNVDGSVIADTYKTGFVDRFALKEAIAGLQQGLQLMPVGARYEFVVPADLAWGKRGVGNKIGPNAVLVFDIRLIELE